MIKRNKLTTTKTGYVIYWIVTVLLILYCIAIIYPLVWLFVSSLMGQGEYMMSIGSWLTFPKRPQFSNYLEALRVTVPGIQQDGSVKIYGISDMIGRTVILSVARTFCALLPGICGAYCYANYKFVGKEAFFFYGIVIRAIPLYGSTAAIFKLFYAIGIFDTYASILFLSVSTFGNFLFLVGFFKSISWHLAEAAFIDGANDFTVFFRIMLPQIVPILVVFFLGQFMGTWNDWSTNFIYMPSKPMIAYGVYKISEAAKYTGEYPVMYAALFMSMLVPLLLFFCFSDKMLKVTYTGGLKG